MTPSFRLRRGCVAAARRSPPSAPRSASLCEREQALDVLGDDVDLEVHEVAGALVAEGRDLRGVRDDGDGEAVVAAVDDGQADAVDGDRALLDDVAQQAGRRGTRRSGAASTISPTPSTWPCTRWPPRRSLEADRALEVHGVAGPQSARGRCGRRSRRRRRPPTSRRRAADDGEAAAVDRDRVAELRRRRARCGRRCAGGRRRGRRRAELLDDAGEHQAGSSVEIERGRRRGERPRSGGRARRRRWSARPARRTAARASSPPNSAGAR